MRVDLHAHSTASDGTDSPAGLVAHAARSGVDVLAITDHDTIAGWDQALAAVPAGMTLIPGVEFSCETMAADGRGRRMHLLGYLLDRNDAALRAEWARLREDRSTRGARIVEWMAADGVPISWAAVLALAGGAPVGRPHIARALVVAGAAADMTSAFAEFLTPGRGYYVRKNDTDAHVALRLLREAGGVTVLAHPLARRGGGLVVDDATIASLAEAGLAGIEIDHPDHDAAARQQLRSLAADLRLVPVGSSDYHGGNKPTDIAACTTTIDAYERLLALPSAIDPVAG